MFPCSGPHSSWWVKSSLALLFPPAKPPHLKIGPTPQYKSLQEPLPQQSRTPLAGSSQPPSGPARASQQPRPDQLRETESSCF